MSVLNRDRARFLTLGLLLLALLSSTSPMGHGQVLPIITPPAVQQDSLALTVNPDRSVGVAWNTTSTLPAGTIPQNISSLFPAGYTIHSSSSFSQQSNKVVQTSTVQYQLPVQAANIVNSISLTATQTGSTSQGSLMISTNFPTSGTNITYSSNLTRIQVNASSQFSFLSQFSGIGPLSFLANQTAFQKEWTSTFGNMSWTDMIASRIQNATGRNVTVTAFNGTITSINPSSAKVSIGFVAQPSQPSTDFVTVFEKLLTTGGTPFPTGLDSIIRSALNLETGESLTLTYNGGLTPTLVIQSTTTYVVDLDAQVNRLKDQLFQILFFAAPLGTVIPASVLFLNSTSVTISQISTTSDTDFGRGTSKTSLKGLLIKPPTVGSNANFTIPGLFQTIGNVSSPGINFTLVGGSNATYSVKVIVPAGTLPPSSTTADSATWTNLRNATKLQAVRFTLVRLPASLLDILLSPTGIAIEAIAAAAIAAGVIFYLRKRRATPSVPVISSGPTPTPGTGPSPAPPSP